MYSFCLFSETSPNPYAIYVGKLSPYHASRTPSPMEYPGYSPAYQPVGMYAQTQNINYPPRTTASNHPYSPSPPMQPMVAAADHVGLPVPMNDHHSARRSPGVQPDTFVQNIPRATYIGSNIIGNNMDDVTNGADNLLDMDVHCNIELNLNRLDSKDLAELAVLDGNLSENLSSNLTLYENKNAQKTVSTGENMTDSLTRLTNSTINELCALNDMYGGGYK